MIIFSKFLLILIYIFSLTISIKATENIRAEIDCVYTQKNRKELVSNGQTLVIKNEKNNAIAYTVWSRKRGAGKEIMKKVIEWAKKNKIKRLVTLSPLTPMATHYHIRNGAKQISINKETQNFEYELTK